MIQLFTQTDKKLIPTLPLYAFEGKIVVVQSEAEAQRAVQYLRQCPILGIDTETRPSFRKGTHYKVALLQIAGGDICFLFRLNYMGFPDCLIALLEDDSILKVGLSLKDDFHQLRTRFKDFSPQRCADLQQLAAEMGIQDMSLAKLYANIFRKRLSKTAQLTNWEADALTDKQCTYAATDAYTCIQLYERMQQLKTSGDFLLLPPPPAPEPKPTAAESKPKAAEAKPKAKKLKSKAEKTKTATAPKKGSKSTRAPKAKKPSSKRTTNQQRRTSTTTKANS